MLILDDFRRLNKFSVRPIFFMKYGGGFSFHINFFLNFEVFINYKPCFIHQNSERHIF